MNQCISAQDDFLSKLATISPRLQERVSWYRGLTEEQTEIYFSEEVEVCEYIRTYNVPYCSLTS